MDYSDQRLHPAPSLAQRVNHETQVEHHHVVDLIAMMHQKSDHPHGHVVQKIPVVEIIFSGGRNAKSVGFLTVYIGGLLVVESTTTIHPSNQPTIMKKCLFFNIRTSNIYIFTHFSF